MHPASAGNHCATVRCGYPILGPRTRPSSEWLEILCLPPSGVTAATAERFLPSLKKMQSRKGARSPHGVAMKGNKGCLASLVIECWKEVWLVFPTFVFSGCNFDKKRRLVWSPKSPEMIHRAQHR